MLHQPSGKSTYRIHHLPSRLLVQLLVLLRSLTATLHCQVLQHVASQLQSIAALLQVLIMLVMAKMLQPHRSCTTHHAQPCSRLLSQQLQTPHLHVVAAQANSHAQLACTPVKLTLLSLFCLPCNEQQPGSAKHEKYIQSCGH